LFAVPLPDVKSIRFARPLGTARFPGPVFLLIIVKSNRAGKVQAATDFCFAFDFDDWSRLAKDDPSAFEARRLALIEEFLRQFPQPDQQRLRGLQFRIDMVRRRARTPMGACLKISSMMWESLLGSRGLKAALDTLLAYPIHPAPAISTNLATTARVIPFRKAAH